MDKMSSTSTPPPTLQDEGSRKEAAQRGISIFNAALAGLINKGDDHHNHSKTGYFNAASNWKKLVEHAALIGDSWEDLVHETMVERAVERFYDAERKEWYQREVLVRLNLDGPIAKGRMRECFRMKKVTLPTRKLEQSKSIDGETVQQKMRRIVRQLSEGDLVYGDNYSIKDMVEFSDMLKESICDVVPKIGRKTAIRIRQELELPPRTIHHPTILTIAEVLHCVEKFGTRKVELAFLEACHGFDFQEDFDMLRSVFERAVKDADSWKHASVNFMAKRYMDPKDDVAHIYEQDVMMQQVCKVLSLQFNALEPEPPKKIDMLHVGLIQLVEREDQPILGYECFVQGDYHKWNTNSGWKDVESVRHTPHAFSFATFRMTKGELMVVDVQGVGDLYTDPQVHSITGEHFGEGNLGPRGMALFMHSFRFDLNPIVQYMEFTPFALMKGEHPEATELELEHFQMGQQYLNSDTWAERRRQDSSEETDSDGLEHDRNDNNNVARLLHKCELNRRKGVYQIGDCPDEIFSKIPKSESNEAKVHMALAKLYEEADPRVVLDESTRETFMKFHVWMGALGGSVEAMLQLDGKNWFELAANRGSRTACIRSLDYCNENDDIMDMIYFLERALECDDGKDERQRKMDMETCEHEVLFRLSQAFLNIGDIQAAKVKCEAAMEKVMEAGEFKTHARYSEFYEQQLAC